MSNYRFILEPYKGRSTRHTCPKCERHSQFVRYVDTTGEIRFPSNVGRCNRESSCGYHYSPKDFLRDHPERKPAGEGTWNAKPLPQPHVKPVEYFDADIVSATFKRYELNSFTCALKSIFDTAQIHNIIQRYRLGTTKSGGVIFWQTDIKGRIRYGKVMHYRPDLHRDKERHPVGAHFLMEKRDFRYRQCFFGEHLLGMPENSGKPVIIVEAEKTACICSEVMPDSIWLATGGKNGFRWADREQCQVLQGRKIILMPDADAHVEWAAKVEFLRGYGLDVKVYEHLAQVSTGTQQDIADHIVAELLRKRQHQPDILAAFCERNPLLTRLIAQFDCEIINLS